MQANLITRRHQRTLGIVIRVHKGRLIITQGALSFMTSVPIGDKLGRYLINQLTETNQGNQSDLGTGVHHFKCEKGA
jgi:hypothetical protein